MKKIMASVLTVILLLVFLLCPANAADSERGVDPRLVGNGITTTTIVFNGKAYTVTVGTDYSSDFGMRVFASTQAYVPVTVNDLTVTYDTINYGHPTYSGGQTSGHFSASVRSVYSDYVPCEEGMAQVIGYLSASGSATFYADSTSTVTVTASN